MTWNSNENRKLVRAILSLENRGEAEHFLRDLLTEGEIRELAKRLEAAGLLLQNVSYTEIEKRTGFSSTTIARVSKWVHGRQGGYKSVINKIHHDNPIQPRRGLS